jgi:phage terminase large subunit
MGAGVVEIELLPKQMEFVSDNEHRHLLYSGAFAAAKSRALCYKLWSRASKEGAVEFLCRKTLESLKKSTLKTLLEPDGDLPPVLLPGTYTHNKSEKIIKIHGGGQIMYFGLDDPAKLGSVNGTGCAIDELVDITKEDYQMLNGRVRMVVPGIFRQLYSACNPGAPSHWAAVEWGLEPGGKLLDETHKVIQTKTTDNIFLVRKAPDYIDSLMKMKGVAFERYVMGKWVGSDGLVYDQWNRQVHVQEIDWEPEQIGYAVDPGYTDPFAILEIYIDGDKRMHVKREFYQRKVTNDDGIAALLSMMGGDLSRDVDVDSAEPSLIETMVRRGIRAEGAIKGQDSITAGINLIQTRLQDPGDGRPRLTVDPSCENLIREFESYEWAKNKDGLKDKPVDSNNHALDALRYKCRRVDGVSSFYLAGSGVEPEKKQAVVPTFKEMRDDPEWGW